MNYFEFAPKRQKLSVLGGAVAIAFASTLVSGCAGTGKSKVSTTGGADRTAGQNQSSDMLVRMADEAAARGDRANAVLFYNRAGLLAPKRADIQIKLGYSLLAQGDFNRAAVAFNKAIAIEPKNLDALRGLGNSALLRDDPTAASDYFRRAIAAGATRDYRVYSGLGIALDMKGDHSAAQAAYRAGLKANPENLALANNLGLSLAMQGKYQLSIQVLSKVVAAPGAVPKHRQNLALVYGLSGNMAMARKIAGKDVSAGELEANLAYYRWLRSERQNLRRAGDRPTKQGSLVAVGSAPAAGAGR